MNAASANLEEARQPRTSPTKPSTAAGGTSVHPGRCVRNPRGNLTTPAGAAPSRQLSPSQDTQAVATDPPSATERPNRTAAPAASYQHQVARSLADLVRRVAALQETVDRLRAAAAVGDRLLPMSEAAAVLGVSKWTFSRLLPRLEARGLKVITIPAASRRDDRPRKTDRGLAWLGSARLGSARHGMAGRGLAWQGKVLLKGEARWPSGLWK